MWVFRFYVCGFRGFGGGNLGFWEVVFWGFLGILVERFGLGLEEVGVVGLGISGFRGRGEGIKGYLFGGLRFWEGYLWSLVGFWGPKSGNGVFGSFRNQEFDHF